MADSYGMKMTLDIDQHKVEEAMAQYGVETKIEIIDLALAELLRKKAVERLMSMQGKFPNFRTNDEIEAAEKCHFVRAARR
jgi:Arc/MetJ family transcription regulator